MTERMAEQDDPFLANEEAPRNPISPRVPILPAEWQRAAVPPVAPRRKRKSPPGGAGAKEKR